MSAPDLFAGYAALTCPDCGQSYDKRAGHCRGGAYGGCCVSFATMAGFDAHRTGPYDDRRCLALEERIAAGWHTDERGYWRSPADDKAADAVRARFKRGASGQTAPETPGLAPSATPTQTSPQK